MWACRFVVGFHSFIHFLFACLFLINILVSYTFYVLFELWHYIKNVFKAHPSSVSTVVVDDDDHGEWHHGLLDCAFWRGCLSYMILASIYRQILIETKSSIWHSCRGHGVVKGNYQHQILTMRGVVVSLACLLVVFLFCLFIIVVVFFWFFLWVFSVARWSSIRVAII